MPVPVGAARGNPERLRNFRNGHTHEIAQLDALDALAAEDATAAEVVKLRYFVGMSIPEIAEALGISPRSADRHWYFARAWLKGAIRENEQ